MKLLISTVIFTLGLNAFAAGKDGYVYPAKQSNKCIDSTISPEDKYYIPAQAPGGKYEGECFKFLNVEIFKLLTINQRLVLKLLISFIMKDSGSQSFQVLIKFLEPFFKLNISFLNLSQHILK